MIKSEKFNHLHIPWNSKYHIQILNTLSSASYVICVAWPYDHLMASWEKLFWFH